VNIEETRQAIAERNAILLAPEVVSLDHQTHIFHFSRSRDWKESALLYVNRNGHHFRVINRPNPRGDWLFAKTWNADNSGDPFGCEPWMIESSLRRSDPEELIKLCGVGPQGRNSSMESLGLLPRPVAASPRLAVYRDKTFPVRIYQGGNRFSISTTPGDRAEFHGKLWESQEAVRWCAERIGSTLQVATEERDKEACLVGVLEDSEFWGAF
jgi:hypothetical protein